MYKKSKRFKNLKRNPKCKYDIRHQYSLVQLLNVFFILPLQYFSMQAKQPQDIEYGNEFDCLNLNRENVNYLDFHSDFQLQPEIGTSANIKDQTSSRGKGRPKGEKNLKERVKKTKTIIDDQNRRKGHWSVDQNKKYHWFLEIYNKHFICKEMRRLDKIFKTMAKFIGSREAQQCRSHHQKMQKKYHSFSNIIIYLRKFHYGSQDYTKVEEDLIKNDINENVQFVNLQQLQDLQETKKITPPTPSMIEEAKLDFDQEFDQPKKQIKYNQNLFDPFGDEFEHKFEFHTLFF